MLCCPQVPTATVKRRSREVSALIETFADCYTHLVGRSERVWVVDTAADGYHMVAHTKGYVQVHLACTVLCGASHSP